MPTIMTLPKIGVDMTEATIIGWLVDEGNRITEGQPIIEAETEKATQEIPSTATGILAKKLVQPGDTVECQKPIAIITEDGEELPEDYNPMNDHVAEPGVPAAKGDLTGIVSVETEPITNSTEASRIRVSPAAKKVAEGLNIDYSLITPSSPGARITKDDVLAFAANQGEIRPLEGVRKTTARRMAESSRNSAPATIFARVDVEKLIRYRAAFNTGDMKVGITELLVYFAARALQDFPGINSRLENENIHILKEINIGVAMDTEYGLVVPVLASANKMDIGDLHSRFIDLKDKARSKKCSAADLADATFTITNLGMYDIEGFIPIINPPQCAILAAGSIRPEPAPGVGAPIEFRSMMRLTLVFDHRIVDGAPAARFLSHLKRLIEDLDMS